MFGLPFKQRFSALPFVAGMPPTIPNSRLRYSEVMLPEPSERFSGPFARRKTASASRETLGLTASVRREHPLLP